MTTRAGIRVPARLAALPSRRFRKTGPKLKTAEENPKIMERFVTPTKYWQQFWSSKATVPDTIVAKADDIFQTQAVNQLESLTTDPSISGSLSRFRQKLNQSTAGAVFSMAGKLVHNEILSDQGMESFSKWHDATTSATSGPGMNTTISSGGEGAEPMFVYLGIECTIFVPIMTFNILTIISLIKFPALREGVSICMISMCCADLSVGVSIIVCAVIDYLPHYMNLAGQTSVCVLCLFLQMVSVHGSCFGLMLTAIERFVAIVYPLRYDTIMSTPRIKKMVVAAWCWVTATNALPLCFVKFSEGMPCYAGVLIPVTVSDLTYQVNSTTPLLITICLYIRIALVAREQKKRILDQQTSAGVQANKRDFKILKMMMLVLGVYLTCFIPCIIFTFWLVHTSEDLPVWVAITFRVTFILILCNSFMNPLIYMWKSTAFRTGLKRLLGCSESNLIGSTVTGHTGA